VEGNTKAIGRFVEKAAGFVLSLVAAVAAYVIYLAGWGASEPAWAPEHDTKRELACYTEKKDYVTLVVEFVDNGRTAIVETQGQRAVVTFVAGGMAGDHYEGDGVSFMYDGEAYVTGMRVGYRGPCQ